MAFSKTWAPTLVDGRAGREGATEAWSVLRAGAGNVADTGATTIAMTQQAGATTDIWNALRRGFLVFDPTTTPLPAGAVVLGATLSLHCTTVSDAFSASICVSKATLAANNNVVAGDYAGTLAGGFTEYADRVLLSAMTGGVRSTWTLNAAGIAAVQAAYDASSPLYLGLLFNSDMDNSAPTWALSTTATASFASQNNGTAGNRPQLIITYRVGPGHAVVSLTTTLGSAGDTATCSLFTIEAWT